MSNLGHKIIEIIEFIKDKTKKTAIEKIKTLTYYKLSSRKKLILSLFNLIIRKKTKYTIFLYANVKNQSNFFFLIEEVL